MALDALVLGTLCQDFFPGFTTDPQLVPGALFTIGELRTQPGGCVANTGFALAELGTSTALAADVGDDAVADLLIGQVQARGVDAAGIRRVPGLSTSYSVVVQGADDRCIWHHPGANAQFDGQRVASVRSAIVHVGYPSLLDALAGRDGDAVVALFDRMKSVGATTSLDMAVVDRNGNDPVDWTSWLGNVLPHTDVFAPSCDDLRSMGIGDASDVASLARRLLALGPAVVMLKDSTAGITLVTAGRDRLERAGAAFAGRVDEWADLALWMPALSVDEASTAGAGDTAVAGLLHGLAQRLGPGESLRCAAAAAAARVEAGGSIPRWSVLKDRLSAGWPTLDAPVPRGLEPATDWVPRSATTVDVRRAAGQAVGAP